MYACLYYQHILLLYKVNCDYLFNLIIADLDDTLTGYDGVEFGTDILSGHYYAADIVFFCRPWPISWIHASSYRWSLEKMGASMIRNHKWLLLVKG